MIKNRPAFFAGLVWLLLAALSFPYRNYHNGEPTHDYLWLVQLIVSAAWFYRSLKAPPPPVKAREPMKTIPPGKAYPALVVAVALFLAVPLWLGLKEPGQPFWNGFLALFLIALVVGAFVGVRYLQKNHIEVGEARFTPAGSDADKRIAE